MLNSQASRFTPSIYVHENLFQICLKLFFLSTTNLFEIISYSIFIIFYNPMQQHYNLGIFLM